MVQVNVSRVVAEVLGDDPTRGGTARVDVDAAGLRAAAGTTFAGVSRVSTEVAGDDVTRAGVAREDVDVAGSRAGAIASFAGVSRVVVEVLGALLESAAMSRCDVDVAGRRATGAAQINVSRLTAEVLAPVGSAGPVSPLALADDTHIFLHNWVTRAELSTSYQTATARSPVTGAESRRGLTLKPDRTMRMSWLVCEDDAVSTFEQLERLEVLLRRMGDQPFQVPIYMDQQDLGVPYLDTDDTVDVDTTQARLFVGARVVIVEPDDFGNAESFTFHTILSKTTTSLTFDAPLGVATSANARLYPVMDCQILLEVIADFQTSRAPNLSLTVEEVPGASALPPVASDTPAGPGVTTMTDGRPVWPYEPDWQRGVRKGRRRDGEKARGGRAPFIITRADRSRQFHKIGYTGKRDGHMWPLFEFWDTRRGRQRSFWFVDQEQYMTLTQIEGTFDFLRILQIGDLSDFSEEFDYVGLLMTDGTMYVREVVNITPISGDFRLTLATPLPSTVAIENVVRVARARLTRFDKDEFTESWTSRGVAGTTLEYIEVLDENDYPV